MSDDGTFSRDGRPFALASSASGSFIGAPTFAGTPVPDQDLNLMQAILADRFADFVRRQFTSGWLTRGAFGGGESIVSMGDSQALVNGYDVRWNGSFSADNEVELPAAGGTDRYDLIFAEFWMEALVSSGSTFYNYGNVDYYGSNPENDMYDSAVHKSCTGRLQLRYRTRYLEDAVSLGNADCHVQGKKANPDTAQHWTFDPDQNIWYCDGGDDFDDKSGFVYALPICAALRPANDDTIDTIYDLRDCVHVRPTLSDAAFIGASEEVPELIMEDTDVISPSVSIDGLIISTTDDTVSVGCGSAIDATHRYQLSLLAKMTKSIAEAGWVVGDGENGVEDGTTIEVETWYYVYLIRQDVGGAIDVIISNSYTEPSMPSGWSIYRMIGEIYIDGDGDILDAIRWGDEVWWIAAQNDVSEADYETEAEEMFRLTVPAGFPVQAFLHSEIHDTNDATLQLKVVTPGVDHTTYLGPRNTDDSHSGRFSEEILTDSSGRITVYVQVKEGENDEAESINVYTLGYQSPRGRIVSYSSGATLPGPLTS